MARATVGILTNTRLLDKGSPHRGTASMLSGPLSGHADVSRLRLPESGFASFEHLQLETVFELYFERSKFR